MRIEKVFPLSYIRKKFCEMDGMINEVLIEALSLLYYALNGGNMDLCFT